MTLVEVVGDEDALRLVGSLEHYSEHPIARAIAAELTEHAARSRASPTARASASRASSTATP